jgi:Zn-dependent protease with chaperone function
MRRRPDRTTPALVLTLVVFVAFGMARVAAPVSGLGLLFDRLSEFSADGAAARWGYGRQLAGALESAGGSEEEAPSRVARLMADHPPVGFRIERLRAIRQPSP